MKLLNLFGRGTAPVARERLQILLAHERNTRKQPDLLDVLREEILALISRHLSFDPDKVQIKVDRGKSVSTLAVDIEIPNSYGGAEMPLQFGRRASDRLQTDNAATVAQRIA